MTYETLSFAAKLFSMLIAIVIIWNKFHHYNHCNILISDSDSLSPIILIDPAQNETVRRILTLINTSHDQSANEDTDILHLNNQLAFYFRRLQMKEWIRAPSHWCIGNTPVDSLNSNDTVFECFKRLPISEESSQQIAKSLRLIRNAFKEAKVDVILTYGSLLGSLRYHTRMPYDSDYDLAIAQKDWKRVKQIFLNLASNLANRMRMIDFRPVTGCVQIGLACVNNDDWNDPNTWKSYDSSIIFRKDIPVIMNWSAYRAIMTDCAVYMDIYIKHNSDLIFQYFRNNCEVSYRPIDGSLFPTINNPREYLSDTYKSDLEICIPKVSYLLQGKFHHLPEHCHSMQPPCTRLDSIFPRNFALSVKQSPYIYEVGLSTKTGKGDCWVRSIFAYEKLFKNSSVV
ncbi:unnamed protein product [Hymenolepis diminuta]|uniref:LicD/FKTN/FKRP nucleotidyltransferase domain-containing protein n=1 Tax=Hymenolepis diminuta TaxID=6216 RepID=A0A564YJ39_HYMDI|nr:unnamed protein product [Hymenolepis diminuta]